MSKELKALKEVLFLITYDMNIEQTNKIVNKLRYLEQALTPPTEQEVCAKLSEYYKINVNFNSEDKRMFYRYLGGIKKSVIAILDNDGLLSFPFGTNLPPHLITLIGRFYSGLEAKK